MKKRVIFLFLIFLVLFSQNIVSGTGEDTQYFGKNGSIYMVLIPNDIPLGIDDNDDAMYDRFIDGEKYVQWPPVRKWSFEGDNSMCSDLDYTYEFKRDSTHNRNLSHNFAGFFVNLEDLPNLGAYYSGVPSTSSGGRVGSSILIQDLTRAIQGVGLGIRSNYEYHYESLVPMDTEIFCGDTCYDTPPISVREMEFPTGDNPSTTVYQINTRVPSALSEKYVLVDVYGGRYCSRIGGFVFVENDTTTSSTPVDSEYSSEFSPILYRLGMSSSTSLLDYSTNEESPCSGEVSGTFRNMTFFGDEITLGGVANPLQGDSQILGIYDGPDCGMYYGIFPVTNLVNVSDSDFDNLIPLQLDYSEFDFSGEDVYTHPKYVNVKYGENYYCSEIRVEYPPADTSSILFPEEVNYIPYSIFFQEYSDRISENLGIFGVFISLITGWVTGETSVPLSYSGIVVDNSSEIIVYDNPLCNEVDPCTSACRKYPPQRILDYISRWNSEYVGYGYPEFPYNSIKGNCTQGYDFNNNLAHRFNYINEKLFDIPYEYIWNPDNEGIDGTPQVGVDSNGENGEDYCRQLYGTLGGGEDCVCWMETPCYDLDNDNSVLANDFVKPLTCGLPGDCIDSEGMYNAIYPGINIFNEDCDLLAGETCEDDIVSDHINKRNREDLMNVGTILEVDLVPFQGVVRREAIEKRGCRDGVDNDCDGFIDCNDTDCLGDNETYCCPENASLINATFGVDFDLYPPFDKRDEFLAEGLFDEEGDVGFKIELDLPSSRVGSNSNCEVPNNLSGKITIKIGYYDELIKIDELFTEIYLKNRVEAMKNLVNIVEFSGRNYDEIFLTTEEIQQNMTEGDRLLIRDTKLVTEEIEFKIEYQRGQETSNNDDSIVLYIYNVANAIPLDDHARDGFAEEGDIRTPILIHRGSASKLIYEGMVSKLVQGIPPLKRAPLIREPSYQDSNEGSLIVEPHIIVDDTGEMQRYANIMLGCCGWDPLTGINPDRLTFSGPVDLSCSSEPQDYSGNVDVTFNILDRDYIGGGGGGFWEWHEDHDDEINIVTSLRLEGVTYNSSNNDSLYTLFKCGTARTARFKIKIRGYVENSGVEYPINYHEGAREKVLEKLPQELFGVLFGPNWKTEYLFDQEGNTITDLANNHDIYMVTDEIQFTIRNNEGEVVVDIMESLTRHHDNGGSVSEWKSNSVDTTFSSEEMANVFFSGFVEQIALEVIGMENDPAFVQGADEILYNDERTRIDALSRVLRSTFNLDSLKAYLKQRVNSSCCNVTQSVIRTIPRQTVIISGRTLEETGYLTNGPGASIYFLRDKNNYELNGRAYLIKSNEDLSNFNISKVFYSEILNENYTIYKIPDEIFELYNYSILETNLMNESLPIFSSNDNLFEVQVLNCDENCPEIKIQTIEIFNEKEYLELNFSKSVERLPEPGSLGNVLKSTKEYFEGYQSKEGLIITFYKWINGPN